MLLMALTKQILNSVIFNNTFLIYLVYLCTLLPFL